jgi:hypothetical protein
MSAGPSPAHPGGPLHRMRPRRLIASMSALLLVLPLAAGAATSPAKSDGRTPKPVQKPTAPAASSAPARTDIAGRWRLDVEKSDFGPNVKSKPRERVDVWEREGAELRVRSNTVRGTGDTLKLDWRCREDGAAVTNTLMSTPVQTVGKLEGGVLHIVFTASGAFGSILTDERWTVAPDRSTLTLERETRGPMGQYRQRYVFRPS